MTRRFFQFSLATLLVFVALICVVLAVRSNRQHNRRVAIAEIESLGGEIDYLSDWLEQTKVSWPKPGPVARLMGDDISTRIVTVYFVNDCELTDAELPILIAISELQALVIDKNPVTDAGLMRLASLSHLRYVSLVGNTTLTDDGIARLQEALPNCLIER